MRKHGGVKEFWSGTAFTTAVSYIPASLTTPDAPQTTWTWTAKKPAVASLDAGPYVLYAYAADIEGDEGVMGCTFTLTSNAVSANSS